MSTFPQLALPFHPPQTPDGTPSISPIYESTESHRKPIYSCAWSHSVISRPSDDGVSGGTLKIRHFATCASSYAHVYQVTSLLPPPTPGAPQAPEGGYSISLLQCYKDPTPVEDFYCVAWGGRTGGFPFDKGGSGGSGGEGGGGGGGHAEMLALAGKGRKISLVNPVTGTIVATLMGHGDEINEIMFVPIGSTDFGKAEDGLEGISSDEYLLLSASKDESIRLWNVRTGTCIITFAGDRGHRDDVLSIDIHPLGHTLLTSG
ncbi:hypothetical protein TrRE_jg8473, partial [Triparma retinervis]